VIHLVFCFVKTSLKFSNTKGFSHFWFTKTLQKLYRNFTSGMIKFKMVGKKEKGFEKSDKKQQR